MKRFQYYHQYQQESVSTTTLDSTLLKRLYTYIRPYRWLIALSIVLLIIARAIETSVPIFIGRLVQQIFNQLPSDTLAQINLFQSIVIHALEIAFLLLICYLFDCINLLLRNWIGQKAVFTMRQEVYGHIIQLPVQVFDTTPVGKLITRTIHDVDQIDKMFSESVVPIIGNILLFLGILVGTFFVDWRIALVTCLIIPFMWLLASYFRNNQRRCYELVRRIVSAINSFLQEAMMGNSIIRHFGLEEQEKKKFREINHDYRNAQLETVFNFAFFFAAIDLLQNSILIGAFITLIFYSTSQEPFQVGTYFTFTLYAMMIFRPIADLAERYNVLQSAISASRRVFDILDQKAES